MIATADSSVLACEIVSPAHDPGVAPAAIALVCALNQGRPRRAPRCKIA